MSWKAVCIIIKKANQDIPHSFGRCSSCKTFYHIYMKKHGFLVSYVDPESPWRPQFLQSGNTATWPSEEKSIKFKITFHPSPESINRGSQVQPNSVCVLKVIDSKFRLEEENHDIYIGSHTVRIWIKRGLKVRHISQNQAVHYWKLMWLFAVCRLINAIRCSMKKMHKVILTYWFKWYAVWYDH